MLDYEDEIESDLSRFHRVDDPMSVPSPRYFRLARMLVHYDGALLHALRRDLQAADESPSPTAGAHVASGSVPTYSGETLAAISDAGGGEFPGIEYSGG